MLHKPDFSKEGVFIIHALHGYELHKERISRLFPAYNLHPRFVTEGDPSLFSQSVLDKYFIGDIGSILRPGILSCTLNHFIACEKVVSENLAYALIFENDPFFLPNFNKYLPLIIEELQSLPPGFIISLENSTLRFPSYFQTSKGQYLYKAKSGRMAGAYIIDQKGAQSLLEFTKTHKCNNVIDWWHNTLSDQGRLTIFWAQPPIVEQGSHNGKLQGRISTKNKSALRALAWKIQKTYKQYFGRLLRQKDLLDTDHL